MTFKIVFLSVLNLILFLPGYGQDNLPGHYEGPFTMLELKCDGFFISNFFQSNDTIKMFGKWSHQKNELQLSIDSPRPGSLGNQKRIITLNIKNNFLYPSKFTRSEYRILKRAAKHEYHPRKEKPYSQYKKSEIKPMIKVYPIQC